MFDEVVVFARVEPIREVDPESVKQELVEVFVRHGSREKRIEGVIREL